MRQHHMRTPAVVHRSHRKIVRQGKISAKGEIVSALPFGIIQACVQRQRRVRQVLCEREIITLFALRRANAIRACAHKHGRPLRRFRKQIPRDQRPNFSGRGIVLRADLQRAPEPVICGESPTRPLQIGINITRGNIPRGFQTAPTERRAFARSAASGGRLRHRTRALGLFRRLLRPGGNRREQKQIDDHTVQRHKTSPSSSLQFGAEGFMVKPQTTKIRRVFWRGEISDQNVFFTSAILCGNQNNFGKRRA